MLPPLRTSWLTALCNSPQCFFDDLADRSAHSRIPNLLPTNQTALDRLPQSLSNEVPFHRAGLDQVENRPKGPSELEALSRLHVARRQIGIVEYENTGNIAVAPEVRWHGHMDLRRIQVRKFVEAKRSLVTVYTLGLLRSVARPECPKDEIGPISHRE